MPSLDELKATRKEIQTLFAVLMQGTWKGDAVEAVAQAKRFVDGLYMPVQADIEEMEKTFTEKLKETIADQALDVADQQPSTEPTAV